jgi:hypothetical protein
MPAKGSGVTSLSRLKARCSLLSFSDPDACWLWKGAVRPNGQAAICVHTTATGKTETVSAPRAVAILKGKEIPKPGKSWTTCGHAHCCNPNHERTGTYAEWGAWIKEQQLWVGNERVRLAQKINNRKRGRINMEIARKMRASTLPPTEEARRWSEALGRPIGRNIVYDVRNRGRWAEASPFSGL